MSHFKLRQQNNCLNCNAIIHGRFCHACGQENTEPKETFWHLVTHFVYDVTHFDGKFFSTVKYLLLRPGFLSKEYMKGRRMAYLNPIRMYVFISAFFFLFFFAVTNDATKIKSQDDEVKTVAQIKDRLQSDFEERQKMLLMDSSKMNTAKVLLLKNDLKEIEEDLASLKKDTTNLKRLHHFEKDGVVIDFGTGDTITLKKTGNDRKQYDSIQQALPADKRDGWVARKFRYKTFELKTAYEKDKDRFTETAIEKLLHTFPKLLFISLPLFALILRLLYWRRKEFYYVDHIIYTVHLYCATFILLFWLMLIGVIQDSYNAKWMNFLQAFIFLYTVWYLYKSLRNFYEQNRWKTILKLIVLNILSSLMTILLLLLLLLFSFFTL